MKDEKLEQSKEQLQELLVHIENAQRESDEYHSHSHHHHNSHHGSGSHRRHHSSHSHSTHQGSPNRTHSSDSEEYLDSNTALTKENVDENKIQYTQKKIESGRSFSSRKSRRRKKKGRILAVVLCVLLFLFGGTAGTLYFMVQRGEKLLKSHAADTMLQLQTLETEDTQIEIENLDDYTLIYNDQKYKYNDDILNFLIVGVDTKGEIENAVVGHGEGSGQSDALLLVAMDSKKKTFTLIPINRDTMTTIDIYDHEGNLLNRSTEQIALSFAYGDGKAGSAELTEKAVSNLFYGLPIHGYIMVNIDAIPIVNDMLGGVEVTLESDYTNIFGPGYEKGNTITLEGTKAERFVRTRHGIGEENNAARMNQQRQYLAALIKKAQKETRSKLTLPVEIYNVVSRYMITDISSSEVAYLASRAVSFNIPENFYRSLQGTTTTGAIYDEFYVDEAALYELILDVFYDKVY